jgi:hypothetical protein
VNNQINHGGQYSIVRRNVFRGGLGGGVNFQQYSEEALFVHSNRLYHNTFYGNRCFAVVGNRGDARQYKDNRVFNNLFYKNSDCEGNGEQTSIADGAAVILSRNTALRQAPGFVDEAKFDFRLTRTSPAIDRGGPLTTTRTAGSGTSMVVWDPLVFYDGFTIPGEIGDEIQLLGTTETARILHVELTTGVLTLDRPLSWRAGQEISLRFSGAAPDAGAFELDPASP